ncbi:hypothetical protein, partial [Pseudomonas viridiflava]|uniref:hypothetical protein n=1 Tax=Pseudomonas viridiflava TaxID=33069 RepID=UPI00197D2B95
CRGTAYRQHTRYEIHIKHLHASPQIINTLIESIFRNVKPFCSITYYSREDRLLSAEVLGVSTVDRWITDLSRSAFKAAESKLA